MGTKGFYALLYKGKIYVIYNRHDSYPRILGNTLLKEYSKYTIQEWRNLLTNCIIIDSKEKYNQYIENNANVKEDLYYYFKNNINDNVLHKSIFENNTIENMDYDTFGYLYDTSYSVEKVIQSKFIFTTSGDPYHYIPEDYIPYDSEYGYIYNLDNETFIYKNINKHYEYTFSYYQLPKEMIEHKIE